MTFKEKWERKGREEGREEGFKEAIFGVARQLLKNGFDVGTVKSNKGLSDQEVRQLKLEQA